MRYFIFISFCFVCTFSAAQKADSLLSEWRAYTSIGKSTFRQDTSAVRLCLALSRESIFSMDSVFLFLEKGNGIAQKAKWTKGMAMIDFQKASLYTKNGDQNAAITFFKSSAELWKKVNISGRDLEIALCYSRIGNCFTLQGKYNDALPFFESSLNLYQKAGSYKGVVGQCNLLGLAFQKLEKDSLAIYWFSYGIPYCERNNDKLRKGILLGNIGLSYGSLSDFPKAIQIYEEALKIDEELGNTSGQLRHIGNMAISYRAMGELELALNLSQRALKMSRELNNKNGISSNLTGIAIIQCLIGDYKGALESNFEALAIDTEIGNNYGIQSLVGNIGLTYQYIGDAPLALVYHAKSLEMAKEQGLLSGQISTLNNIGIVYFMQNLYSKALEIHLQALEMCSKLQNKRDFVYVLGSIANNYKGMEMLDTAIMYYERAIVYCKELGMNANLAHNTANMAEVYYSQGSYTKALENNYTALAMYQKMGFVPNEVRSYGNIALAYHKLNDTKQAEENAKISIEKAHVVSTPEVIRYASRVGYIISLKGNSPELSLHRLSMLRQSSWKQMELSYFSLSEKEREEFFGLVESDFGDYFDFTVKHHQQLPALADTMYNIVLGIKGLSLRSNTYLRNSILQSKDTSLIRQYDRLVELKNRIARELASGIQNKDLEREANELERTVISSSKAFSDFDKVKNLDWKNVRDGLKKGECAIEFVNFETRFDSLSSEVYAALLVRKESEHPTVVQLCTQKDLERIFGNSGEKNVNYVKRLYGTKGKYQSELYRKIWQPLEPHLKGINTIYYSPSGLLHTISISALSKGDNVYIADSYRLKQCSSTGSVAVSVQKVQLKDAEVLLMGGIDYSGEKGKGWSYLPGTEEEVKSLNSLFAKNKMITSFYSSSKASEDIVKSIGHNADIIHIATHGFSFSQEKSERQEEYVEYGEIAFRGTGTYADLSFISNSNPMMRSGLVMAGANSVWDRDPVSNTEDGILTALEVSNLNLSKAKLVVLSACETGLGQIKGSEGVYGLQRAFKMAGAQFIIMSLWQVPDKETSEFMRLFYSGLFKSNDVREAFEGAQKTMRKKYDPYFWAAFVLME
jgi:CHAT domain-containing protein